MIFERRGLVGTQILGGVNVLLTIIGVGAIVAMVLIFYGNGFDGRQLEAWDLNYQIVKCIQQKGLDVNNFHKTCGLNEGVIQNNSIIGIYEIKNGQLVQRFNVGNTVACGLKGASGNEDYPKCMTNRVLINNIGYEIVTGSKQASRRQDV